MYNILLFVEDNGHEVFLGALIQRFASMYNISIDPKFGNAEGGYGKCERDFYKGLLRDAIRATGVNPPLGGIEYGEDIVNAVDLEKLERAEASLGHLLKALRQQFQTWQRIGGA